MSPKTDAYPEEKAKRDDGEISTTWGGADRARLMPAAAEAIFSKPSESSTGTCDIILTLRYTDN